jgi:hypothetical protein
LTSNPDRQFQARWKISASTLVQAPNFQAWRWKIPRVRAASDPQSAIARLSIAKLASRLKSITYLGHGLRGAGLTQTWELDLRPAQLDFAWGC